jgi:diguanylate cyclase (GGDEF)-like protein
MAGHDSLLQVHPPSPLPPELPLRVRGGRAALRMSSALAGCDEAGAIGRRALAVFGELVPGMTGAVMLHAEGSCSPLAAHGLDDDLLRAAAAVPPPQRSTSVALAQMELERGPLERLAAAGRHGALLLPFPLTGERAAVAILLLPAVYRLSADAVDMLDAVAAVVSLALQTTLDQRRQDLAAQLAQLTTALGAAHDRLAAENDARQEAETLVRAVRERLEQRSAVDTLTGLTSGRRFHTRLEVEVERSRRYGDELGLLLIDIDDFKRFNERHGRAEGDRVLTRLGEILRQGLRKMDHAFRYGGEEFTAVLPRCDQDALLRLAERLRQRFAAETFGAGGRARLSISVGAAVYRRGLPVESFIRSVDNALYRAKTGGRNRVVLA